MIFDSKLIKIDISVLAIIGFFLIVVQPVYGQVSSEKYKLDFSENQRKLDQQFGGIGISISRPKFGDGVQYEGTQWVGVDLISDYFHFNYSTGKHQIAENRLDKNDPAVFTGRENTGRHLCIGGHFPLGFGIGSQASYNRVYRVHPVLGFDFGVYKFWEDRYDRGRLYYMSTNAALRLRIPYAALELGGKFRLGLESTDYLDVYRGLGFEPYLTLRLDGLKLLLAPAVMTIGATHVSAEHLGTNSSVNYYYQRNGTVVKETNSTSYYDVNVSSGAIGIQDIGPFIGIGPRFGFNNYKSEFFSNRGRLFGLALHSRMSMVSLGLNIEGGRIGHATIMQDDGEEFRRRVDKTRNYAKGSNTVFNTFFDVGYDLSDGVLAMLGTVTDRTGLTSYFSLIGGYSFGFSVVSGHEYDPDVDLGQLAWYENAIRNELEEVKDHYIGGENGKSGYLGGWYIAADVGALQTRFQWYKYYRSPLLNNFVISISYRFPLDYMRD